jgi:hypothetical protein
MNGEIKGNVAPEVALDAPARGGRLRLASLEEIPDLA